MTATDTPISISVNFDSINEATGFPEGFRDPSFFVGFDRFAELVSKHGLNACLYVVGRDLENPEVRARLRDWTEAGFEVGSHSLSHPPNLGCLPLSALRHEVGEAHKRIGDALGTPPTGFIAPAWSSSRRMLDVLLEFGYRYDTSIFPSAAIVPVMMKVAFNHLRNASRLRRIINRADWLYWTHLPRTPFVAGRGWSRARSEDLESGRALVELPLPSRNRLSIPHWHTKGFLFGWDSHYSELERLLTEHPFFYYLVHPADFMASEDLPAGLRHSLERFQVPVSEKLARLDGAFARMAASGRPATTMQGLADAAISPLGL